MFKKVIFCCLSILFSSGYAIGYDITPNKIETDTEKIITVGDSGSPNTVILSEDSDISIFLKRDGFYDNDSPLKNSENANENNSNTCSDQQKWQSILIKLNISKWRMK